MKKDVKKPWRKSPPELEARFAKLVPEDPRVERRRMFGYPSAFAGGNLFMGLFQDRMFLRLGDDARGEILKLPGASLFEPMAGRPMRSYVVLPEALLEDNTAMRGWIARSLHHAATLPAR